MEKIKEWPKRMVKDILKEADILATNIDDIQDEEVEQIVRKIVSKYIQIV